MMNINRLVRGAPVAAMALALGLIAGLTSFAAPAEAQQLRRDPAMVEGPDACGECHKSSIAAWKETHHAMTFRDLPRSKKGREIASAMGLKRIKAGSDCLTCHFTSKLEKGEAEPIAGISCESCHGAGKEWIKVHSDFGGKGVTAENEDPAHKKERYAKSEAAGMIRPSHLYKVAENCYSCHTVPNEKLVNTGGHPAGSDFELVAWSQGEVRHNVWYSKDNNGASTERQRMMFIVGQALDLEYALRGVAKATEKAGYAVSMAKRAAAARKRMAEIAAVVDAPELKEIVAAGNAAGLKLNNEAELTAAADKVKAAAEKFAASYDGSKFAGVDPMLPAASAYKGPVYQQ